MTPSPRPQFRMICCAVVRDAGGAILLVREAKAANRGQWNLPGGHVESGESPIEAVARELREETNLQGAVQGLLGIYWGTSSVRFVFLVDAASQPPRAGDEILATRYFSAGDIARLEDVELVRPATIRMIFASIGQLRPIDLSLFHSVIHSPPANAALKSPGTMAGDVLRPCG